MTMVMRSCRLPAWVEPTLAHRIERSDSFAAMTSARSYETAMPVAEALEELRASTGTRFSPAVVAAFEATYASRAAERVTA